MKKALAGLGFLLTGAVSAGFCLLISTVCWIGSGRGSSSIRLSAIAGLPLGLMLGAALVLLAAGLALTLPGLTRRSRCQDAPEAPVSMVAGLGFSVTGALLKGFLLLAGTLGRVDAGTEGWTAALSRSFWDGLPFFHRPGLLGGGILLISLLLELLGLALLTAPLFRRSSPR